MPNTAAPKDNVTLNLGASKVVKYREAPSESEENTPMPQRKSGIAGMKKASPVDRPVLSGPNSAAKPTERKSFALKAPTRSTAIGGGSTK